MVTSDDQPDKRTEQIIDMLAQLRLECDLRKVDFFQLVQLSQPRYLDLKEKDMK